MKNKEKVVTHVPSLKKTIERAYHNEVLLILFIFSFLMFNIYYFFNSKTLSGHIVFFSLFIFPFGLYQFFKSRAQTLVQRMDDITSKILIFYIYASITLLTFHVYFWRIGQPIVYYLFTIDLVLIFLCLVGSYIFHSEYLFTKWHQENIKIDGNNVFFKNLHYINGAYEKPKNFILAKIRSIFVAVSMLIIFGLAGLGGAAWPVLSKIVGETLTSQLDPIYFVMYGLKIIFLVTCASIIYPTMYYWVWWRATRQSIVEKYGSIEIECSDVDAIRYR